MSQVYEMKNYGRRSTFASFLPGIAGIHGIPLWCCYVNRGQGVVSFGMENKDHAIMEYYPAHLAYQNVKRTGFRTFLRRNGQYFEAFSDEKQEHSMQIGMNQLKLREDGEHGIRTEVSYTILPEERIGALIRKITLTNTGDGEAEVEVLDGMPALIPYGIEQDTMKNMTQTAKAWMQAERFFVKESTDGPEGGKKSFAVPFYRLRASLKDSAQVTEILGGNFGYAVSDRGEILTVHTDPEAVFAYDLSLEKPIPFQEGGLTAVDAKRQNTSNIFPCCFFEASMHLMPGESRTFYELVGQVENQSILRQFLSVPRNGAFFERKIRRALQLTDQLTEKIATKTGNQRFDDYCRYTYMDNVMRGGEPIRLGHHRIFYVYSRKHGDLERDYNYFSMLPEYYSQGNGNFRDVNQNRRMDSFFSPYVERENIHTFYSLIQLDGYNPLQVEKKTYVVSEKDAKMILSECEISVQEKIFSFVTEPFTPGRLYLALEEAAGENQADQLFNSLIDFAEETVNGNFGEGYWSDHWDYNLDLIEEYLSVYPDKEQEMLYEKEYTWFLSQANINPRSRRYEETGAGLRQYHALNQESLRNTDEKLVRSDYGRGEIVRSTLLEKLILLSAVKFAALDPWGMGIEMEGGKPGWYDALNGLPGMLGSSMAETYELARHLDYVIRALCRYPGKIELLTELSELITALEGISKKEKAAMSEGGEKLSYWNQVNDVKEIYRDKTYQGILGTRIIWDSDRLTEILTGWREIVGYGIEQAVKLGGGICPTYFYYEVTDYEKNGKEILPKSFRMHTVPYFLEGPTRYLKLDLKKEQKKALYRLVKGSDLYDAKLSMYKVNGSLEKESYELGRARAFTPGWLENESIWLHMEYKYLLELLKSGLYEEFFTDFHRAAVPFLDEEMYGRSVLENSSFLASSKNPDPSIHGKGFVARLSGSTVEFLNIWKIMMFGSTPFIAVENQLRFAPRPSIPAYLMGEDLMVSAKLMGEIDVIYRFDRRDDYTPGNYHVTSMEILSKTGVRAKVLGGEASGKLAEDIRRGKVQRIEIEIRRN